MFEQYSNFNIIQAMFKYYLLKVLTLNLFGGFKYLGTELEVCPTLSPNRGGMGHIKLNLCKKLLSESHGHLGCDQVTLSQLL
jgi:hypothetical protein